MAWDPHKMMLLPLAAGVVLVRDEARPRDARSRSARPTCSTARATRARGIRASRSFLCSRRADVLKLWVAFQRYGDATASARCTTGCAT